MKKVFLISLVLLLSLFSFSQQFEWISVSEKKLNNGVKFAPELLSSKSSEEVVINYSIDGIYMQEVSTDKGLAGIPDLPGTSRLLIEGAPDLIKLTASVIIPDNSAIEVNIIEYDYVEFENIEIAPSKGNLMRNQNPDDVPFVYGDAYLNDEFYPGKLADFDDPYIIRDFRGVAVHTYPLQYNPVSKVLRVYNKIVIEVVTSDGEVINPLVNNRTSNGIDREFGNIYERHFINFDVNNNKYTPLEEAGGILVISYPDFIEAMAPYVEWKNQMGRHTEIVDVTQIGSTPPEIKAYILDYFNNNDLTYILLVGEAYHIPPFESGSGWSLAHSDNMYTYLVGQDHYPDAFIGRFSVVNVADVETMVQRTLEYEMGTNLEDGWLNRAMGVARNEGAGQGHNGESDCQHMDLIRDRLLTYNYDVVLQEYDHNCTGVSNTNASQISASINEGVSMINYCNHGSTTGWSVASYEATHVNALTNVGKLPFIWSVACVNGNFVGNTCFAETWTRATHNGQPTGALATFMSTVNQGWVPPMDAQDEFNDIIIGAYADNIKRTFAGIAMNGCMKMNDLNGNAGYQETDAWTVFGDPSLSIRTDNPLPLVINHDPEAMIFDTEITVESDVIGAFISLTIDNQIIGTGIIGDNGSVTIEVAELDDPEKEILVVATAYNRIPAFGNIEIIEELLDLDIQAFRILDPVKYYACTGNQVAPKVVVRNKGEFDVTSFELYYRLNNEDENMINWEGLLTSLQTDTITLSSFILEEGEHTFTFYVKNPNDDIDEDLTNDTLNLNFTVEDLELVSDFEYEEYTYCNAPMLVNFINNSENANAYFWDFGDGHVSLEANPSHVFTELGVYNVHLVSDAGDCGYAEITKTIIIGAHPPQIEDQYLCSGQSAEFYADGDGEIFWFDDENLSNLIAEGNTFNTEILNESETYYVYSLNETIMFGAKEEPSSDVAGGYFTGDVRHGLVFNSEEAVVLKSAYMYSNAAKDRHFVLEDAQGNVIDEVTVFIPDGEQRVELNINIPEGNGMILYGPATPNLYREGETGSWWNPADPLPYPYTVGDFIEIIESTAGGAEANYYYYFYDWEVEKICQSPVIEVNAVVSGDDPNADFTYEINHLTVEFTNLSNDVGNSEWDFGDGSPISHETNPIHTYEEPGTYTVGLAFSNACGEDHFESQIVVVSIDGVSLNTISIYPNPTSSTTTVEADFVMSRIQLLDITGRIISDFSITDYSHKIDMSQYDSGLYLIRLYDSKNNDFILRLVVE